MPIHRNGWMLVLVPAVLVTVLAAGGILLAQSPESARWFPAVAGGAAVVVFGVLAFALTRTKWGR